MQASSCQSIREKLIAYFETGTVVDAVGDSCVVTLPIPTLDGRFTDVFVEARMTDFFLVHDGGKAVNELILHGVKLTDSVEQYLLTLGRSMGVAYADEMFTASGKARQLESLVFRTAMCSSLAMSQLARLSPAAQDDSLREQFGRALRTWARKKLTVSTDVAVEGRYAQHRFDFVVHPKRGGPEPIAISVLSPGGNSLGAAERFGFKFSDLDSTRYQSWRKVAVIGRAEAWSSEAHSLVRKCSAAVIEIPSSHAVSQEMIESELSRLVA